MYAATSAESVVPRAGVPPATVVWSTKMPVVGSTWRRSMFTTTTRIIASARSWSVASPSGVWFCTGNGFPSK